MAKDTITVKGTAEANKDGSFPVAVWERDEAHPDGEAFVAGPTEVEVGKTYAVTSALQKGEIEVVGAVPKDIKEAVVAGKDAQAEASAEAPAKK